MKFLRVSLLLSICFFGMTFSKSIDKKIDKILCLSKKIEDKVCGIVDRCCSDDIIDSQTGCVVSSQAVLDARDVWIQTYYDVCPQIMSLILFATGQLFLPPDTMDITELVNWQQWKSADVEGQLIQISEARTFLSAIDIPTAFEQERQELASLAFDADFWRISPLKAALSPGVDFNILFDSMGGLFGAFTSTFGINITAFVLGLDLTLLSWQNYAPSLKDYIAYLKTSMDNNIVFSQVDLDVIRQVYFAYGEFDLPVRETIAFAPFLNGTVEQQIAAEVAFEKVREVTLEMIDFLKEDGLYAQKVVELRGPQSPGLGAPGLNPIAREVEYPYDLNVIANTLLTAEEIHELGLSEVDRLQSEIVEVANTYILPEDQQVENWAEFSFKFRTDPEFLAFFQSEIPAGHIWLGFKILYLRHMASLIRHFSISIALRLN